MGLDAQVIAIGPFSAAVAPALEYGADGYAGVASGVTVVTNVFLAGTSADSHLLASAFEVGAMELGRHHLDPGKADLARLTEIFGETDVAKFQCLALHGFDFYYLPNG